MRRHDQKQALPASLFLPPSRGRNTPREEGCSNSNSTMSACSEPTEVRLDNTYSAPAGLPTRETTRSKERSTAKKNAREIERDREILKCLEDKARREHRFVKDDVLREELIASSIRSGLEEDRLKELKCKIQPKASRLVRESNPLIQSEVVLEPLIKSKMREMIAEETKAKKSVEKIERENKVLKHLEDKAKKSYGWVPNL